MLKKSGCNADPLHPLDMVAGEGLEPTVLHLLCGANAAVGSAALTVPRTVIHSRLTLRAMSPPRCSSDS